MPLLRDNAGLSLQGDLFSLGRAEFQGRGESSLTRVRFSAEEVNTGFRRDGVQLGCPRRNCP